MCGCGCVCPRVLSVCTVAILPQGTSWAVAFTQAFCSVWALCLCCQIAKAPPFLRSVSDVACASSHLGGCPSGLMQSIPRMYVCLNITSKRASIDTRCVAPRGDIDRAIVVVQSIPAQLWVAECCCRAFVWTHLSPELY